MPTVLLAGVHLANIACGFVALPTNDSVGLVGLRGKNTENSNKSLFMFLIDLFVGS